MYSSAFRYLVTSIRGKCRSCVVITSLPVMSSVNVVLLKLGDSMACANGTAKVIHVALRYFLTFSSLSLVGRTKNSFRRNLASFEHLQESFLSSRLQGMYGRKLGKIGVHIKCQQDHGELWTRERKETWCVANHTYVNFSIIHDQRSICGPMQRRGLS